MCPAAAGRRGFTGVYTPGQLSRYSFQADAGGSIETLAAMLKIRCQAAWSKAIRDSSKTGLGVGQYMAQGQPGEVVRDPLPVLDMQPAH